VTPFLNEKPILEIGKEEDIKRFKADILSKRKHLARRQEIIRKPNSKLKSISSIHSKKLRPSKFSLKSVLQQESRSPTSNRATDKSRIEKSKKSSKFGSFCRALSRKYSGQEPLKKLKEAASQPQFAMVKNLIKKRNIGIY